MTEETAIRIAEAIESVEHAIEGIFLFGFFALLVAVILWVITKFK